MSRDFIKQSYSIDLSVIIPVRLVDERLDILERLSFSLADNIRSNNIEFLVVDDGSSVDNALKLQQKCRTLGLQYVSTKADVKSAFNLARARNCGAKIAQGDLLIFLDVDLIPYPGFYQDLLIEAELLEMRKKVDHFLMCPVIYLSKSGYEQYKQLPEQYRKAFAINQMNLANKDLIEKYSHGTSVIMVNRYYYMSRGGQDESFEGWGYEDYEFATRLIRKNLRYPLPRKWDSMAGNFTNIKEYKGWKAIYRLYGDWLGAKGIYLVHAPHVLESSYHQNKLANEQILLEQLKRDEQALEPAVLTDSRSGNTAILQSSFFSTNRYLIPFLGGVFKFNAEYTMTDADISSWIKTNNIKRFLFSESCLKDKGLRVYQWCKNCDFNFIVCGKGALANTVYHDPNGGVFTSKSYREVCWNIQLNSKQQSDVNEYIKSQISRFLRKGSLPIEKNKLKNRLGLEMNKKILLVVPTQCGDEKQVLTKQQELINKVIKVLSASVSSGWQIVTIKNVDICDYSTYENVKEIAGYASQELLEIAEALITTDAELALYAMMHNSAVYLLEKTWYSHLKMNRTIVDMDILFQEIDKGFNPDNETILRFIYYLRFVLYSQLVEGQNVAELEYYELRGFSEKTIYFSKGRDIIAFDSPQFDRYWGDSYHRRNNLQVSSRPKKQMKFLKEKLSSLLKSYKNDN